MAKRRVPRRVVQERHHAPLAHHQAIWSARQNGLLSGMQIQRGQEKTEDFSEIRRVLLLTNKVTEAEAILLNKKPIIERLASRLYEIVTKANGDFSGFRPHQAGMGGVIRDYWVLLRREELEKELENVGLVNGTT